MELFWHKHPAVGGCFPIGQTDLSDKCLHLQRLSDKEVITASKSGSKGGVVVNYSIKTIGAMLLAYSVWYFD